MNLRWLRVGCVAVAVALVGIVIVVSMSGDSCEGGKRKSAELRQLPTAQPNLRKSNVAAAVPVEKAQAKGPTSAAVAPAAKKERKPRGAFQPEAPEVAAMRERVREIKVNWETTAEESLSGMLSYEPGDMYIERDFNDAFMKSLTVALVTPIVIEEDDHPLVKQKKEEMIALKEQMKDILDREGVKGLKAELVAAQADLMRANSLVKDMEEMVQQSIREGKSEEELVDMEDVANKYLESKGVKTKLASGYIANLRRRLQRRSKLK